MKLKTQFLILIYILVFSSCASDDENVPVIKEEETIIEQTAIVSLSSEDTNEINFGNIVTNITTSRIFSIENSGNSDLKITNISIPDNYTIDVASATISSSTSKEFTITFIPTEITDYSDSITIESNATNDTDSMPIIGFGVSPVFEGSVTLKTQEEVEDFAKLGYTEITGALHVGNINTVATMTSLASLNKLTNIGSLQVINTGALEDLNGLENLNVSVSIQLLSNFALKNVDALVGVTKLSDYLSFLSNSALIQIDGLSNITEVGDNLRMKNHPLLTNLDGLSGVRVIQNQLIIEDNPLIKNLNGLSNLESIGDDLSLGGSPLIENLDGLSNLKSASLLRFTDNDALFNYCGIQVLLINDGADLHSNGHRYNRYNPTKSEIVNGFCSEEVPFGVYDGNLLMDSSNDIEKFVSKGFHTIRGSFGISGEAITSLDFLSNLTTVNADFVIRNTGLTNLEGLENLIYVNQLWIQKNSILLDYCGLNSFFENGTINLTTEWGYLNNDNLYNPTLEDLQNGLCIE